ncbi:hypothetical protein M0802_009791 [Mischocyttarus mexicanus]|nr:hypothetical protein M0802_009791 [Mischocyttarus mexicanus]
MDKKKHRIRCATFVCHSKSYRKTVLLTDGMATGVGRSELGSNEEGGGGMQQVDILTKDGPILNVPITIGGPLDSILS